MLIIFKYNLKNEIDNYFITRSTVILCYCWHLHVHGPPPAVHARHRSVPHMASRARAPRWCPRRLAAVDLLTRCPPWHRLSDDDDRGPGHGNGAAAPKYPPFVESVRRRRLNVSDIGCEVLSRGWFSAGGQPHTVAAGWPRWHASWAPGRPTSTCGCWRVSRWCLTSNSTLLFVIGVTNRIKRSKVQHENRNKKTKREAKEHRRTERRSIRLQKGRNP